MRMNRLSREVKPADFGAMVKPQLVRACINCGVETTGWRGDPRNGTVYGFCERCAIEDYRRWARLS